MMNDKKALAFFAGWLLVVLGMLLYGIEKVTGQSLSVVGVVWYAFPFTIGGCLMVPKLWPGIMGTAAGVINAVFGRSRTGGGTPSAP